MQVAPNRRFAAALEARDVSVRRCGRSLVQRVSFTADRGELLVLLGDAGSGTDTLVQMLAGRVLPDAGRVLLDGRVPLDTVAEGTSRVHLAEGPDACAQWLADRGDTAVALLDRPVAGLDDEDARDVLDGCRRAVGEGRAIVATLDRAGLAAAYASTIALFVAGRLLSWGTPGVALVPALQLLGGAPEPGR